MSLVLNYDQAQGIERALVTRGRDVADCFFNALSHPQQTGLVQRGTVDRMLKEQKGAFIRLPSGINGYLADASGLQMGADISVQVKAEAREEKGAALTRAISLPGLYFIHQPLGSGIQRSRKNTGGNGAADKALAGKPGGWIIRRAAEQASFEKLDEEAAALQQAGERLGDIHAPSAFEQALLAHAGAPDFSHVLLEAGTDLDTVTGYLRAVLPSLLAQIRLSTQIHAFDTSDLESFYAKLCSPTLVLPRGGSVRFEQTHTMQVIDVDGATRTDFAEVNREAAALIMKHLRWRNLGGLVVIDFLKMKVAAERNGLANTLRDLVAEDPAPCEAYGFTRMGLFEISRARRGFSLAEILERARA